MKTIPFYLATVLILWMASSPDAWVAQCVGALTLFCAAGLTSILFVVQLLKRPIGCSRNRREWQTIGILSAFSVFTLITLFPIRLAYLCSLPELERMAADVKAGKKMQLPQRAGFFTIRKAEVAFDGYVCLWTSFDHEGFVHCPKSEVH